MTGWTAQAEMLVGAISEPGYHAAEVAASAWRAGVHPEATHGLVGAAIALTGGQAMDSLWAQVPPCPQDSVLLEQAAELEGTATGFLRHCGRLIAGCVADRDAAAMVRGQAAADLHTALSKPGMAAAAAAARDAIENAGRVVADCEAALEILRQAQDMLGYALTCLRRVPGDFAQHYEVPYTFQRQMGPLPVSGEFLTGAAA